MELQSQIKKYRTQMHLSEEELAESVFVTKQTVSDWEAGKIYPDLRRLFLLCNTFEISIEELLQNDIAYMRTEIQKANVDGAKRRGAFYAIALHMSKVLPNRQSDTLQIYREIIKFIDANSP